MGDLVEAHLSEEVVSSVSMYPGAPIAPLGVTGKEQALPPKAEDENQAGVVHGGVEREGERLGRDVALEKQLVLPRDARSPELLAVAAGGPYPLHLKWAQGPSGPPAILSDEAVLAKLPVLFRTLEGDKVDEEVLDELFEAMKKE